RLAVPDHLAEASAIACALPQDPDTVAEVRRRVVADRLHQIEPVEQVDTLDAGARRDLDPYQCRRAAGFRDVSHHQPRNRRPRGGTELRILVAQQRLDIRLESEMQAAVWSARRSIVPSPTQAVDDRVAT